MNITLAQLRDKIEGAPLAVPLDASQHDTEMMLLGARQIKNLVAALVSHVEWGGEAKDGPILASRY